VLVPLQFRIELVDLHLLLTGQNSQVSPPALGKSYPEQVVGAKTLLQPLLLEEVQLRQPPDPFFSYPAGQAYQVDDAFAYIPVGTVGQADDPYYEP
jgi:hypothetical protein